MSHFYLLMNKTIIINRITITKIKIITRKNSHNDCINKELKTPVAHESMYTCMQAQKIAFELFLFMIHVFFLCMT